MTFGGQNRKKKPPRSKARRLEVKNPSSIRIRA
jgi:hypothetical protein